MIKRLAIAPMPTNLGQFRIFAYEDSQHNLKHYAISYGELGQNMLIRIHSACITSEIFRANNCDCREQIDQSLQMIAEHGQGAIIYLDQEGRGNGIEAKLKALSLIVQGVDTCSAYNQLGFPEEARSYQIAVDILNDLGVQSPIMLITNNPGKVKSMQDAGFLVSKVINLVIAPKNQLVQLDLETKRDKLGHFIPQILPQQPLSEDSD